MLNLPKLTRRQVIVTLVVVLASAATCSYNRLLSTSMPDLRGVWGIEADHGSILLTLALAPQLLLAPVTPWLSQKYGVRKTVLPSSLLLIGMVSLIPLLRGYVALVVAHAIVGALLGVFITLTVTILSRTLPTPWMVIALAFYAFGLTSAMNTGATVSVFYIEQIGWKWIYRQTALFMALYFLVVFLYLPRDVPDRQERDKRVDFAGMLFFCAATMLLYIGLYQGERLGWFDSGLVSCCFLGAILLFLLFCLNELIVPHPWAPPHFIFNRNVILTIFLVGCYTFIVTINSTLITSFLGSIHNHKPEQAGWALLPIPLLHFFFIPVAIILIRYLDGRLVFALGAVCFAVAYRLGMSITVDWKEADFLPVAILFAMGHPLCHIGMMSMTLRNFHAERRIGILAFLQVFRVTFPALATALTAFVERVGRDTYTLRLQEHLIAGAPVIRMNENLFGDDMSQIRSMIATEASVRAYQDAFQVSLVMALIVIAALFFMRPSKASVIFPIGIR